MKKTLDGLIARLKLVEREVSEQRADMEDIPSPTGPRPPAPPVMSAIMTGQQRFTKINAPALFIYASPHDLGEAMKGQAEAMKGQAEAMAELEDVSWETIRPPDRRAPLHSVMARARAMEDGAGRAGKKKRATDGIASAQTRAGVEE